MSQTISCPHCKQPLLLPAGLAAAQIRCPRCKKPFAVPAPAAAVVVAVQPPPLVRPAASPPRAPAVLPARAPAVTTAAPSRPAALDSPSVQAGLEVLTILYVVLRLLPAGLLALILLSFMIRDRFIANETEGEEQEAEVVELPIDPDPLLDVQFQRSGDNNSGTLRFGLTMAKEKDDKGKPKRLTFTPDGGTNNALVRIDGDTFLFGKFIYGRGGSGRKGEDSILTPDKNQELQILRGRWRQASKELGEDRTGRRRIGVQSIYRYDAQKIEVTQTVEIVPGEQVAAGQTKRRLDTCLVRYRLENQDEMPHRLAFRFVLDTFIGSNDGVPFTIPGASGLCNTSRDFAPPDRVPDFIQALERPSLDNPGTVAHLTLRLGGGAETPDRVTLGRWINQLQWGTFEKPHIDWEFPVQSMKDTNDSGVILYWNEKEIAPGGHRDLGFAYGLGSVASSEGGKLGLTVGGSFRPGEEFTLTALVQEPLPQQTVTLELPKGLTRVEGEATQSVPALPAGAASPYSPVTWKIKAARAGRFNLRVKSSNGLSQSQAVTISSKGIFN